ncbi:MAG: DUF4625 domain-containing protein [Sphingobacterium sp.]|jgi:hypothetical protein|nr:DUF4625 domain-containing protein [Sphingobacterium sp.]
MKATRLNFLLPLCLGFIISFTSCKKDDPEPKYSVPKVDLTEVGANNGKTVIAGSDLHLEAQLTAEALIQKVDVEIHQQEGSFEIKKSYTEGKYIGVKSTEFHEHLDIPEDAPGGVYHLHLTVYDKKGQSSTAESELTVRGRGPVVNNLKYGSKDVRDDGIANVGLEGIANSKLYISGEITSVAKVKSVVLRLDQKGDQVGSLVKDIDITDQFDAATGKLNAGVSIPWDMRRHPGTYNMKITVADENALVTEINSEVEVSINPFIENFELGSGHDAGDRINRIAYIGKDVHIQGDIYCLVNRLSSIRIEIVQDVAANPRILTKIYDTETGYFGAIGGTRNDHFHQHIDIPADMPEGKYNFSILVTDRQGLRYERKLNLQLKKP